LDKLESFLWVYNVSLAECSFLKILERLESPFPFVGLNLNESFLDLMNNREQVARNIKLPGKQYHGPDRKKIAALRIQTAWRRYTKFSYYEFWKRKLAAGVIFLKYWRFRERRKFGVFVQQCLTDKSVEELKAKNKIFKVEWPAIYKRNVHINIVLNSFGVPDTIKSQYESIKYIEINNISRLFELIIDCLRSGTLQQRSYSLPLNCLRKQIHI
jgi:hypothetical protein